MNFDGAVNMSSQLASTGGMIRNVNWEIIATFSEQLLPKDPILIELQALAKGIKVLLLLGINICILEGDSLIKCHALQTKRLLPWRLMSVWRRIMDDLAKIKSWEAQFCTRRTNEDVYGLSKIFRSFPIFCKHPLTLLSPPHIHQSLFSNSRSANHSHHSNDV